MTITTDARNERPDLNKSIEYCYMECAGLAGGIRTHFQTGTGVISYTFEQFYFNVSILFELTSDLPQMDSAMAAKKKLEEWLDQPPLKSNNRDLEDRCKSGLVCFREYKVQLCKNGVLALPS